MKQVAGKVGIIAFILVYCASHAQTIENIRSQLQGNQLIILYDLVGAAENIHKIELYISINDFSNPAVLVEGDVGEYVLTGKNKQITWKAREEVGSFKGDLRWEVRGEIMPSFMQFSNIKEGQKIRRGKSFVIKWEKPSNIEKINVELFKINTVVRDLGQTDNTGTFEWKIPPNVDTGSDYRLRAISGGKVAFSSDFRISPKIPLLIKLSPVFIGAIVGVIVLAGGESGGGTQEIVINDPIKPN